jgi:hypothetical protein
VANVKDRKKTSWIALAGLAAFAIVVVVVFSGAINSQIESMSAAQQSLNKAPPFRPHRTAQVP